MNKEISNQILIEIKKAKNILLHCHLSPDPDSVGSALAMKLTLEQIGKKVTLIQGDDEMPKAFVFPGVETITPKNFFEIDLNDFDLFIILDTASADRISMKGKIEFPDSLMTIVIDHHISNRGYGKINLIDSNYPATAQILYDLFKDWKIKLNHDIALNLFMGMYTDTGGFRYGNINPETFQIVAELTKHAPDFTKTIFIMENSNRKEAIIFEGIILSSMKTFLNDKLAVASIDYNSFSRNNFHKDDMYTGYISNKLKSIIGIEIAATFIEQEPNQVKISLRTRDENKYDVSKLAVALGGGGHKAAAGVRLNMTMREAIEKVVKTAKELYNL